MKLDHVTLSLLALALGVACSGNTDGGAPPETPADASPQQVSTGAGGNQQGGSSGSAVVSSTGGGGSVQGGGGSAQGGSGGGGNAGSNVGGVGGAAGVVTPGDAGGKPSAKDFLCNMFIGVSATQEWIVEFDKDTRLDQSRWEFKTLQHAYLELWANPNDAVWQAPVTSACTQHATNPDRVIFTGVNWTYTTAKEWETTLTTLVQTIVIKYSGVKEIDLVTMIRAPNNMFCTMGGESNEQVVAPFIDQAIQAVASQQPNLVKVGPQFFAPSCNVFQPMRAHYTPTGAVAMAKAVADIYLAEP